MAFGIRVASSALADLDDIRAWYREQGVPEVGDRVVAGIVERIEALAGHPDLGRVVPEFEQPFLRELIHFPFRIVYRRDPDLVRIVRVWRGERRLGLPGGLRRRRSARRMLPTDGRAGVVVGACTAARPVVGIRRAKNGLANAPRLR